MMGRSLLDLITGQAPPDGDRIVFQELSYENNNEMRAAASQHCHVIYNVSPHTSWEIYRLDGDPTEHHDVSDDPGPCAATRGELERWYDASQVPEGAADALLSARPDIAHPLDVDFGGEVRLLEAALPAQVRAGDSFPMTLTYEARGRLGHGWKVFAHFEAERGGGRFTADHAPARPFDWWRPGQFIRYTQTVSVPRSSGAGRYHLWLGLWKGSTRRPAQSPGPAVPVVDDRVDVGSVEVVR
jgi:hypothetical protein